DLHTRRDLDVVARRREGESGADEPGPARGIGQRLRDDVDHPAEGIGAVQHARRPANQLDTTDERRLDRRPIFIAPRVVLEPATAISRTAGAKPWRRTARVYRPGASATRKAPSAPAVTLVPSSVISTIACGTGWPALSTMRPVTVSARRIRTDRRSVSMA